MIEPITDTAAELIEITARSVASPGGPRRLTLGSLTAAFDYLRSRWGLAYWPTDAEDGAVLVDKCELYRDELLRQVADANGREKAR